MNTGIMSVVSTIARLGVAFAIPVLALSAWASTAQGQSSIKPGMVAFVNRCGEDLTFVGHLVGVLRAKPGGRREPDAGTARDEGEAGRTSRRERQLTFAQSGEKALVRLLHTPSAARYLH